MKFRIFILCTVFALSGVTALSAQVQRYADQQILKPRSFLSNYGVSLNAAMSGIGGTASVSLHKNLNLRVGYDATMLSVKLTANDYIDVDIDIEGITEPELKLKGKLPGQGFHMLLDYNPFKRVSVHSTSRRVSTPDRANW